MTRLRQDSSGEPCALHFSRGDISTAMFMRTAVILAPQLLV